MYLGEFDDKTCISIHAPLRERPTAAGLVTMNLLFQSTLPYGSDAEGKRVKAMMMIFQSTLPYGSDHQRYMTPSGKLRFQSTLPYGSDLTEPPIP